MKILQLKLIAFGLFTNQTLDFSKGESGLHLISGLNEAGKSTSLRAIKHLLFGIPETTADTYRHPANQLRLGAKLRNVQGEELDIIRRKGRKQTLFDTNEDPLNEAVLSRYLGGINEAQFSHLFCLDHPRLLQGGQDLLTGGGDVGESLFEAGTGSLGLHDVLTELDREADTIFKARGTKPLLNQKKKAYDEICQKLNNSALDANTWATLEQSLNTAKQQLADENQRWLHLQTEYSRLDRIKRTSPLLQRHQQITQQLAPLENIVLLPKNATARRVQASSELSNAEKRQQQAQLSIQELETQLQSLEIPHSVLVQKQVIDNLRERLGSHQKAAHDLPKVNTEMRSAESDAQSLLRRIYPHLSLADAPALALDAVQREKIKHLADQAPALREKQRNLQERLDRLAQQLQHSQHNLQQLPAVPDVTQLRYAVGRAAKQQDLEDAFAKEDKEMRLLAVKIEVALKQLPLWEDSLDELEKIALPSAERIESFDARFKEIKIDQDRLKERLLEMRTRLQNATQKLEVLRCAEVPTEADLAAARELRQQHWQTLTQNPNATTHYPVFEEAMLGADEIADRLRREAGRVAEQANLLVEKRMVQAEKEKLTSKWHLCNENLAALQSEWDTAWDMLPIKPWTPPEMRKWLHECLKIREQINVLRERRQQLASRELLINELRATLQQALQKLPDSQHTELERLADLLSYSEQYLAKTEQLQRQHVELTQEIQRVSQEQQQFAQQQENTTQALHTWQTAWQQALQPLQLPADTLVETARNVLENLDQVLAKLEKIESFRRRIERMEEDALNFRSEVAQLVATIAPQWTTESVEQVIPLLAKQASQAEKDATRAEQLQQALQTERARQAEANRAIEVAKTELQTLLTQAHCSEVEALELAESASIQKKDLQQKQAELERQLLESGDGASLEELAVAALSVDKDQLGAQLQSYLEQIQAAEQARSELDQRVGGLNNELKRMDGNGTAALAADEAQSTLAEIQELSTRYMQVQLAATVLRKAIERYREQHQAPIVQRASELFKRLTLGRFTRLESDYTHGDHPILVGIRTGERQGIPTEAMSDGTRDQLYLALYLASIERYLTRHTPLPLVLDDILINFDDERSRATLSVLGELCQRTQVLFFTHHPRLEELARKAVPSKQLIVHHLDATPMNLLL
ncbi:MAG: AAA family ATPase [Thiotrichaceae bacterium]|nr:AAA family ATPase [Thiotrichaceae bacterium]